MPVQLSQKLFLPALPVIQAERAGTKKK